MDPEARRAADLLLVGAPVASTRPSWSATLDEGEFWPTHFAIPAITDGVREQIRALLRKAVG